MDYSCFDSFQDGVLIADKMSNIKHVNSAFAAFSGYSQKRLLNRNIREIFVFGPEILEQVDSALRTRTIMPFIESEIVSHDQERKQMQIACCPFGEEEVMVTLHDVSVEQGLQKKYKREIGEKEKYIEILNRKIFELEFMLDIVGASVGNDSIEPFPNSSFEKIVKTLDIDMALVMNRGGEMYSSDIDVSAAYVPEGKTITGFRDIIRETLDYWKPIDLDKVGTESPSFVHERSGYTIVTSLVRGKQSQWRVFLFFFNQKKAHLATLNKSLLTSLSKQLYLMIENQSLFHLAVTDEKTESFNARFFKHRFQNELLRARKTKTMVSLMVIDIDFFKKFNDTYGHLVGDWVLKNVAKTLRSVFRVCDVVARFGGEEFVVFCPETDKDQAKVAAERARAAVEAMELEVGEGKKASVTISIGIATFPEDGGAPAEITKFADDCVYKAKKNGRNRVEVHGR
jgi:diguanylate cyclase (GGDEF)-like protein/PAS domain S-box-containing protein